MVRELLIKFLKFYRVEFLLCIVAILTLLLLVPLVTYFYFSKDLFNEDFIMNKHSTGLVLVDRNNKPLFEFYSAKHKEFSPLTQIPDTMKNAIIIAEDKDFYSHPGFSIRAILAAFIANIKNKGMYYGGSTITQQLVKNTLLTSDKNFMRKYQEVILANEIERRFSKEKILEMYLNSVYFGEGAFGIEAAAKTYFNKKSKDLTLPESALIASLPKAPSALSPLSGNRMEVLKRKNFILEEMYESKYITQIEKIKAEKELLSFHSNSFHSRYKAPHFALMVKEQLIKKYGEETIARSGFVVRTTINSDWQTLAETIVQEQVESLQENNVSNGAAVIIDPKTGEIKTLVGSVDWHNEKFGKVNIPTMPRQPGSSFKPIVYAKAFEQHIITPATILKDTPTTFEGGYKPKDYDKKYRGLVIARRALANSLNIPSVEIMSKLGVPSTLEMAKRLGITTLKKPSDYGLSLVLGTGEITLLQLTNAYAVFANYGVKNNITSILEIKDKYNRRIYTHRPAQKEVLSPEYAFLITSILSDSNARSEVFGNTLTVDRPAAVKTGTTEDYRDSWTIGYTPQVVVGTWVGNNDNSPMDKVAGSLGAAPIWKKIITNIEQYSEIVQFEPPENIVKSSICKTFLHAKSATPSSIVVSEYFVKGTEPQRPCYAPRQKAPVKHAVDVQSTHM